ncbi:MAG: YeeE/YedE family protein [Myxococcales bacterium]
MTKALLSAFASGLLFALGLAWSGMTDTRNVLAFLDVSGTWNPSLLYVMLGAIAAYASFFWPSRRLLAAPVLTSRFVMPDRRAIDVPLFTGSALFGVGWGIAGYCPGPALASLPTASWQALAFTGAMMAGLGVTRLLSAKQLRRRAAQAVAVR